MTVTLMSDTTQVGAAVVAEKKAKKPIRQVSFFFLKRKKSE